MNGRSMLAGLQGAMEGFRFGREIMGDTPEDRQARAAIEAARTKTGAADRKLDLDIYKFNTTEGRLTAEDVAKQARHQDDLEIKRANAGMNRERFDREGQWHEEGAPLRQAQTLKAQDEVQSTLENRAYQQQAQQRYGDFQAALNGNATPEQVERVKGMMPWIAQDAERNSAALKAVIAKGLPYYQAGDLKSADAMFSTPEGQQALNGAFGHMFSYRVGQRDYDNLHVVTGAKAVGVTRSPDGKSLGFKIETTQEPTPEFRKYIEQQIGAATSEDERNQLRTLLQPHSYVADMTEGRVPVSQGGQTKYLSQEDFAKGMSFLDQLAELKRKDPDFVERVQTRLGGMASAESPAKGLERANIDLDKLMQRKIAEANLKLSEQRLALEKEGKDPTEHMANSWRGIIGRQMPGPDEDDVSGERQRLSTMQMLGEDIIRAAKGRIDLEEVMQQVLQKMPVTAKSAHGMLDGFFGGGSASEGSAPSSVTPEQAEIGKLLREGKITKEQAVEAWKKLGAS